MSEQQLIELTPLRPAPQMLEERKRLERQARLLAWGGIGYHFIEAAVAVAAGLASVWRCSPRRRCPCSPPGSGAWDAA